MRGVRRTLHRSIQRSMCAAVLVLAVVTVACAGGSGGDDDASVTTQRSDSSEPPSSEASTNETPSGESGSGESGSGESNSGASTSTAGAPGSDPTVSSSTIAIVAVPDDVVPGIDSGDPFCRAWSEFAGSFQALAGAGSAADVLEVAASAVVSGAVRTIAEEFPEPIASERDMFVNDVIGPFARRAERAGEALRAAGLSASEIELLGELWLTALVEAGVDGSEIDLAVPDDLVDAVATAVEGFTPPAIAEDPSLVTQASTPATFEFLAANCPDQGILAGNDAID